MNADDRMPTKQETLEDILDGYLFVMSGGRGQPIDEAHREIAEELASEDLDIFSQRHPRALPEERAQE